MSSRSTRSGGAGGGARGAKRPRTNDEHQADQFKRDDDDGSQTRQQQQQQPNNNNNNNQPRGRPQLLLNTDELRKRTGKKYCDESELVPLLLAHGLIRRVRTIAVEVRPLSGESFDISTCLDPNPLYTSDMGGDSDILNIEAVEEEEEVEEEG